MFAQALANRLARVGVHYGWAIVAIVFLLALTTAGCMGISGALIVPLTKELIQTHFIALCGDYGMPAVAAASTLAMMGVFDFVGAIGSGWLPDRFDNRALLSMYYGLRGLSLLYLPNSTFTVYGLTLFAVFYGLDWIATVPPTVRLSASHFGRERAGVVYGWVFASHMIGAAVAAWGGGFFRSTFNTYLPAFYIAGFACLIAAAAVWLIGRTQGARKPLVEARA